MSLLDRLFPSRRDVRVSAKKSDRIADSLASLATAIAAHDEHIERVAHRMGHLEERLGAIDQAFRRLGEDVTATHALLQDLVKRGDGTRQHADTASVVEGLANKSAEAQLWLEKISSETTNALAHLDGGITNTRAEVGNVSSNLAELRLWVEKLGVESQNTLAHLDSRGAGFFNRLEVVGAESANHIVTLQGELRTQFNSLFNHVLPQVVQQSHEVAALVLAERARAVDRGRWAPRAEESYKRATKSDFDSQIESLKRRFPTAAAPWSERLDAMLDAFATTKSGNAANASDLYSRMFRSFVEIHVRGRVLDVGCGVFGRPYYLDTYPAKLISGVEPLPVSEDADFERVRGVAEALPWPDGAFSTVVNATSLDHSLSLDAALREMGRVLCSDGVMLLWIGSIPGSAEFAPDAPGFVPADQFHLFHFDVAWFEPMLEREWEIIDRLELQTASFSHVFYALQRKIRK